MDRRYGLYFPVIFETGGPAPVGEPNGIPAYPGLQDSIESSLRIIIPWGLNSRFFIPPFGSILERQLQAPNTLINQQIIRTYILRAIRLWETRIAVNELIITSEESSLTIDVDATILETKTQFTFILTA